MTPRLETKDEREARCELERADNDALREIQQNLLTVAVETKRLPDLVGFYSYYMRAMFLKMPPEFRKELLAKLEDMDGELLLNKIGRD